MVGRLLRMVDDLLHLPAAPFVAAPRRLLRLALVNDAGHQIARQHGVPCVVHSLLLLSLRDRVGQLCHLWQVRLLSALGKGLLLIAMVQDA